MTAVRIDRGVARPAPVAFTVDGAPVSAPEGEPLATALACAGLLALSQECAIYVDGVLRQACLTPVRAGLTVELRGAP